MPASPPLYTSTLVHIKFHVFHVLLFHSHFLDEVRLPEPIVFRISEHDRVQYTESLLLGQSQMSAHVQHREYHQL